MAVFTWIPSLGASLAMRPNVRRVAFGDGYEQRLAFGIHTQAEVWTLEFRGRTIPVTMSGGAAGGMGAGHVFNISVNVSDAGAATRGDSSGGRDLGQAVANAVRQELLAQKRAGGLLDSRRAL